MTMIVLQVAVFMFSIVGIQPFCLRDNMCIKVTSLNPFMSTIMQRQHRTLVGSSLRIQDKILNRIHHSQNCRFNTDHFAKGEGEDSVSGGDGDSNLDRPHTRLAIVGGGLAGLSTAYHFLSKIEKEASPIIVNPLLSNVNMKLTVNHQKCHVTIFDTKEVGKGGASSVAGGLLHPLSPNGKLVHWGLEGLESTNRLVTAAINATATSDVESQFTLNATTTCNKIVLRDEIYRLVTRTSNSQKDNKQIEQMKNMMINDTKDEQKVAEWFNTEQLRSTGILRGSEKNDGNKYANILGGLRLYNGCKVIHVPSYLEGLFLACQHTAKRCSSTIEWRTVTRKLPVENNHQFWQNILKDYDIVVYAAGSGMFLTETDVTSNRNNENVAFLNNCSLPIQLVAGQSIIVNDFEGQNYPNEDEGMSNPDQNVPFPALLSGKYISPLPDPTKILIGATHEYKLHDLMIPGQVIKEMKSRTYDMKPNIWKNVDNNNHDNYHHPNNTEDEQPSYYEITRGVRVQSERGMYGRLPIIGRFDPSSQDHKHVVPMTHGTHQETAAVSSSNNTTTTRSDSMIHPNSWIFTGLSSRGLLYHSLYGDILTDAILHNDEELIKIRYPELLWWKKKKKKIEG